MKSARTGWLLLVGTLLGLIACDTEPAGPSGPGALKVTLRSLFRQDAGAAVVELIGSGIDSVSAIDGDLFLSRNDDAVRVVVLRDQPGQIEFLIHVDDRSTPPVAHLIEVADSSNQLWPRTTHWFHIEPLDVVVGSTRSR